MSASAGNEIIGASQLDDLVRSYKNDNDTYLNPESIKTAIINAVENFTKWLYGKKDEGEQAGEPAREQAGEWAGEQEEENYDDIFKPIPPKPALKVLRPIIYEKYIRTACYASVNIVGHGENVDVDATLEGRNSISVFNNILSEFIYHLI